MTVEIIERLSSLRDQSKSQAMAKYMRDKFAFLGITSPDRKQVIKEYIPRVRSLDHLPRTEIILALWQQEEREYQYAAMDLYIASKSKLAEEDMDVVVDLLSTKQWWDTIDLLASHLVGHLWKKYPHLHEKYYSSWLKEEDIWLNRTCLLYQLKYRELLDTTALEQAITALQHKNEFFIQKAIGWILRQYSRYDPGYVISIVQTKGIQGLAKREALKLIEQA